MTVTRLIAVFRPFAIFLVAAVLAVPEHHANMHGDEEDHENEPRPASSLAASIDAATEEQEENRQEHAPCHHPPHHFGIMI